MSKKGKTTYNLPLNADQATTKQIIETWLNANSFKPISFEDRTIYRGGNIMVSCYQFLEYRIENNLLTIEAYLKNPKKPYDLSEGMALIVPATSYLETLRTLFDALNKLNQGATMQPEQPTSTQNSTPKPTPTMQPEQPTSTQNSTSEPVSTASIIQQPNQESPSTQPQTQPQTPIQPTTTAPIAQPSSSVNPTQDITQSITDASEKQNATNAEVAFWLSLATMLCSLFITWGGIICVLEYILAIRGLKSKKRSKAIAAIVFASITTLFSILSIILQVILD